MTPPPAGAPRTGADTVFFLSDYGRTDEFVGVVHAVLRRLAPESLVIDLSHEVAPFSVEAGAQLLLRALPHLGRGVVLAVVDPGVGGARRGVVVEVAEGSGPTWFVGPDNGLLWPAIEAQGGAMRVIELATPVDPGSATFDGRDLFAPAVAGLCRGEPASDLGPLVDPGSLVGLDLHQPSVQEGPDGRRRVRAGVTWVDRFGNAQLSTSGALLPSSVTEVTVVAGAGASRPLRRVRAFAGLARGEAGVLIDANGRLALVVREGSAAAELGLGVGSEVEVVW